MQWCVPPDILQFWSSKKLKVKMSSVKQLVDSQIDFINWEYSCDHHHNKKWVAATIQHENRFGTCNCISKVESYRDVILALLFGKWDNFISLFTFILICCSRFIFYRMSIVSDGWKTDNFYDWYCVVLHS
jgi:hypothetical protein